ncbi:hypothetical protein B0H16DRAFT_1309933, partial [Mycena metata]
PMSVVEMALEVEVERARAAEALSARDAAIQRLSEAYVSLRQKITIIERLQQVPQVQPSPSDVNEQVVALEMTIKTPREQLAAMSTSSVPSVEPEEIIKARHAMLASIPLPADPPDDCLKPIVIPPPFTLHEFLANASGVPLSNYRVLQELTTSWCPDREEHGYLLTPLFKCSTNPRVATAHRWNMVDVMARMSKPTECFYNKDGNWYYAGVYRAFRLEDLTTKEWEALSNETTQALVRDTIASRKNTSPQNIYETSQLYAAGALRVACLGLQCVGFNKAMYHAVLEQAAKCAAAGKWKVGTPTSGTPSNAGLGAVGGTWNAAAEGVLDGSAMAGMSMGGSENVPVQGGKGKK